MADTVPQTSSTIVREPRRTMQKHANQEEGRESRAQLLDVCKTAGTFRHERERHTVAMPNIHMVQRLQRRRDKVDELVGMHCYGLRESSICSKKNDEMRKEKKQKVEIIQCAVRRPCKDPLSPLYSSFLSFLHKDNNKER